MDPPSSSSGSPATAISSPKLPTVFDTSGPDGYPPGRLKQLATTFKKGVFDVHGNSFSGADAVAWIVRSEGLSAADATAIAQIFLRARLFKLFSDGGAAQPPADALLSVALRYQFAESNPHDFVIGKADQGLSKACAACGEMIWADDVTAPQQAVCRVCNEVYHPDCINDAQATPICLLPSDAGIDEDDEGSDAYAAPVPNEERLSFDAAPVAVAGKFHIPLAVFINCKSGGKQGEDLLRTFTRLLSAEQVFDLGKGGPAPGLNAFKDIPNHMILGCGGDGTVGWILSVMDKIAYKNGALPPVGVLPLGTGNDLARVFGWGGGYDGEKISSVIYNAIHAKIMIMDRWKITVTPFPQNEKNKNEKSTKKKQGPSEHVMNNYMSVGFDAKIALQFHEAREANPGLFFSRSVNKLWYFKYGSTSTVKQIVSSDSLVKLVQVTIDDKPPLDLKDTASLIVLNIPSYSAGADLWGPEPDSPFTTPSFSDRKLEVVGISSTFHMGRIQAKLSHALRLGQGSVVRIKWLTGEPLACQVDGEPFEQPASDIVITHHNQVRMLQAPLSSELKPTGTSALSGERLKEIAAAMADPKMGVKRQNKQRLLHSSVQNVFSGSAAVDWLMVHLHSNNKDAAIAVGRQLLAAGLLDLVVDRLHSGFTGSSHVYYGFPGEHKTNA